MRFLPTGILVCALVIVAECGGDDDDDGLPSPPIPEGTPREQVAATVNGMFDAWNRGDGELACSYMTRRGQRLAVRIAQQLQQLEGDIAPDDCVRAIADTAAATDETIGQTAVPENVSIDGRRAFVASEFRGALRVKRSGGRWLVDVPAYLD
jgi:hypothetical protein